MKMLNASPHFLLSNPFSLLLPLLLFIISAILIFYHVYSSTQRRNGGILPAGSEGWPFIGETLSLIAALKSENPETFTDARARRYGRIFTTHVFGERTVFSTDPDFNRLVLNGEGRSFENSYPPSFAVLFGRNALLLMKEPLHGRIHALTTNHFSSMSVLRDSLLPKIDGLVRGTLNSWNDGETVMLLDQAKKMSFELIIMQLISEDPSEWTEALRREYLLLVDGLVSLPLPLPSFLSSFSTYGKALRARAKLAEALLVFVRERRAKKRELSKDMLDVVITMEDGLDNEGMVDFLLSIVVAGYDTTSTVMTTAIKFLTDNPPALAQLKEEHEQIMRAKKKHDDPLEWSDYQSMTFTQCVINETLRLTNFAVGVLRRATTDINFKGYTIPKGCKVFPWFVAVHLNAENFKDPKAFDPWRWQSANITENGKIFTPFGGGPRLCPGNKLGRLQISVFLHYFVTRLEWEATEKDNLIFFPIPRTRKGYSIIVKRKPLGYGH